MSGTHCLACGVAFRDHIGMSKTCGELLQSRETIKMMARIIIDLEASSKKDRHQRDCARKELRALTNQLTRGK